MIVKVNLNNNIINSIKKFSRVFLDNERNTPQTDIIKIYKDNNFQAAKVFGDYIIKGTDQSSDLFSNNGIDVKTGENLECLSIRTKHGFYIKYEIESDNISIISNSKTILFMCSEEIEIRDASIIALFYAGKNGIIFNYKI